MKARFLASVRTPAEAVAAIARGADVIDCKEPSDGALGALPLEVTAAVVRAMAGRVPVSATIGDLPMNADALVRAVRDTAATGVDFVKVGLFDLAAAGPCVRAIGAAGARCVAVVFADREPFPALAERDILATLAGAGFVGVMLDTAGKSGGGLRTHLSHAQLRNFVADARARGLFAGLAGSLGVSDIAPLVEAAPDLLGFRSALCGPDGRAGGLDADRVALVRHAIDAASGGDHRSGRISPRAARSDPAAISEKVR